MLKKSKLLQLIVFYCLVACVKNDDFQTPDNCPAASLKATTSFSQIKSLFKDETVQINEDLVIEGFVTSSDKAGNFFGTLHFQDKASLPEEGLQIDIDLRDYHLQYEVGDKIFIKLKGLYLGLSQETYKLGGLYTTAAGTKSVGRLPFTKVKQHIIGSCDPKINVASIEIGIEELSPKFINTLVTIKNMQVSPIDICKNYAPEADYVKRKLQDCSGNTIELANSGYAEFYSELLPSGSGAVTGILGYASGRYTITIRDTKDIEFENLRCDGTSISCEAPATTVSISELKDIYKGEPLEVPENFIIGGVITATDQTGNFNKEIYMQDAGSGIKININSRRLYEEGFEIDNRIIINCRGLFLDEVDGELQLGVLANGDFKGIEPDEVYRYIYLLKDKLQVTPVKTSIGGLIPTDVGKLIELENVQFTYPLYQVVENNNYTEHPINDCDGNLIELSTLKTATFKNLELPQNNGTIQGILSKKGSDYVLRLRDENDFLNFSTNRCDLFESATAVTINYLKSSYPGFTLSIKENIKIRATVISDSDNGNFGANELVAQDANSGILLLFNTPHELPVNYEVDIALWNTTLRMENGVLQIDEINTSHILQTATGNSPQPILLNLTEASNPDFQSMLVSFNEIQFVSPDVFLENNTITNCEENIVVPVKPEATFFNAPHPEERGSITGVLSAIATLRIRQTQDFMATGVALLCYVNDSDEVFISELADPDNNADARFVELFNAGETDVLLDDWKLVRYTNNNPEISSEIDLSGIKIRAGKTLVISPNATVFEQVYGFAPDLAVSANSPADSNGDDNLVLLNRNGEIADIFGVIGEDGSGTDHEFEDGRALRKTPVMRGNTVYLFDEWIIYNDTGSAGTINQPQNAPEDFTPGAR